MDTIQKILKIAELAMRINGEHYERGGGKPCIFFEISPHVNEVAIVIYKNGYFDASSESKREIISAYYSGNNKGYTSRNGIAECIPLDKLLAKVHGFADEINPPEQRPDIVEVC